MELDFRKNNIVNSKEDEIERIISKRTSSTNIPELANHIKKNKDIIMASTLMSILFKVRNKSIYMKDKIEISSEFEEDTIFLTQELIKMMYSTLEKRGLKGINRPLLENASIINDILLKYISDKKTNYIAQKFFIETLINQNSQKEILELNPYMITELLNYQQNPLTTEEKIIREIIDYYIESQQCFDSPKDLKYVLHLLGKNSKAFKEPEVKMLYIVSNTYQQSKEQEDYKFYNRMREIIENPSCNQSWIINYLNQNQSFTYEIINKFIKYNIDIQEGELKLLETRPTAQYAKKIYKKNP